jgi:hypothetical protein
MHLKNITHVGSSCVQPCITCFPLAIMFWKFPLADGCRPRSLGLTREGKAHASLFPQPKVFLLNNLEHRACRGMTVRTLAGSCREHESFWPVGIAKSPSKVVPAFCLPSSDARHHMYVMLSVLSTLANERTWSLSWVLSLTSYVDEHLLSSLWTDWVSSPVPLPFPLFYGVSF